MDVLGLGGLFGGPFLQASNSMAFPPLRAPLIGYGQRFEWSNGMVYTEGHETADGALWRGAHMLYRSVTPRKMRKVMSKDQRERLVGIARRKLGN